MSVAKQTVKQRFIILPTIIAILGGLLWLVIMLFAYNYYVFGYFFVLITDIVAAILYVRLRKQMNFASFIMNTITFAAIIAPVVIIVIFAALGLFFSVLSS